MKADVCPLTVAMTDTLDSTLASLYPEHLSILQQRAAEALQRAELDHLVVPAGVLRYQYFDDRDYPFAVNPQFKAWLPVTQAPGSWLVITPGSRPRLIFMQPHDYWHTVPSDPTGYWPSEFEISIIRTPDEALKLLPSNPARCAILGEDNAALGPFVPNNPPAVLDYLEFHRHAKTAYEIAMMREATRIGVIGHRAAEQAFRDGLSEFDIHLAYCAATRQDANDLPYCNIIGLNEHAAVLHYMTRDRQAPTQARSFLIDAGASYQGYASDITRTYSAQQDEFQALIDAVDRVQLDLCAQVLPGIDYRDIHMNTHAALSQVLRDFDLIRCSPEAALSSRISNAFFPHGVGHPIGLQVHDVAGFHASDRGGRIDRPEGQPYLRMTRTLVENSVVTIEPGLYFIDMLLDELRPTPANSDVNWDRVAAFKPFGGIRIEDNVVATRNGAVNLTREAFAAD